MQRIKKIVTSRWFLSWLTLFIPMYLVTLTAFWIETGSLLKGAGIGLVIASVKTLVGSVHHSFWGSVADIE